MGWIIVGGVLLIAAFVYVSVQMIVLLALAILWVASSTLKAMATLFR